MQIDLMELGADGLTRQLWSFEANTDYGGLSGKLHIRLEKYEPQRRATKRSRTWKKDGEGYQRRGHNGVIHYGGMMMAAAKVPMPPDWGRRLWRDIQSRAPISLAVDPVEKPR